MKKLIESWRIFVEEEKAWEAEEPEEENYSGRYEPAWMETMIEDAVKVALTEMDMMTESYDLAQSRTISFEELPDAEAVKEYVYNYGAERDALVRSKNDAVQIIIEIVRHLYYNNDLTIDFSEDNYKAMNDLFQLRDSDERMNYRDSPEILSQFEGLNKYLDSRLQQGTY